MAKISATLSSGIKIPKVFVDGDICTFTHKGEKKRGRMVLDASGKPEKLIWAEQSGTDLVRREARFCDCKNVEPMALNPYEIPSDQPVPMPVKEVIENDSRV